jgi:type IV pilus assembly protein PilV
MKRPSERAMPIQHEKPGICGPLRTREGGFTLIEILVAIVILSVGLLGLAGLQANGLQANHGAYLRSQASILAYDMIDAMRANRAAARAGNYDVAIGASVAGASIAAQDVTTWKAGLAAALPAGDGAIARGAAPATDRITITIQWDDTRAGGSATEQFTMVSQL